jgi:hypothetical protein
MKPLGERFDDPCSEQRNPMEAGLYQPAPPSPDSMSQRSVLEANGQLD